MKPVEQNKLPPWLPLWVLLLDAAGSLLIAAGLFLLFAGENLFDVEADDLTAMAVSLIVIGATMMIPLLKAVIQRPK